MFNATYVNRFLKCTFPIIFIKFVVTTLLFERDKKKITIETYNSPVIEEEKKILLVLNIFL